MNKISYLLFLTIFLLACGQPGENSELLDYYYPVSDLEDGKIYIYRNLMGYENPEEIWFYKSFKEDKATYLGAQLYDSDMNVTQFQLQNITRDGALLEHYYLYNINDDGTSQPMESSVTDINLFPFYRPDTLGIFLSSFSFIEPIESVKITMVRNRRFLKDTSITIWGEVRDAVIFELKEAIDYDKEGVLTVEGKGKEIYAKGIGLVAMEKTIQNSIQVAFELDTIVEMDYFLNKRMTD